MEEEVGTWQAFQVMCNAEEKLINIAKPLLLSKAKPEQIKYIEKVFNCKYISIREQLVNLILRWDATT